MGVSLTKGGNVSLTKQAPNLTAVTVGLGWDVRSTTGTDFDLDASAIACGENKKVLSDQHFIFFNNLRSPEGAIEHTGDNLTGQGDGDDEAINVDLAATPPNITNIFFPVSIYEAESRSQSFGQVQNAFIRVVDRANGTELARYDLSRTPQRRPPWCSVSCTGMARMEVPRCWPGYASGLSESPATTASTSKAAQSI